MTTFITAANEEVITFVIVPKIPTLLFPHVHDEKLMQFKVGNYRTVFLKFSDLPPPSYFRGKRVASVILNGITHDQLVEVYPALVETLKKTLLSLQGNFVSVLEDDHV